MKKQGWKFIMFHVEQVSVLLTHIFLKANIILMHGLVIDL